MLVAKNPICAMLQAIESYPLLSTVLTVLTTYAMYMYQINSQFEEDPL